MLYALALAPNRRPSEVVTFRVVTASTEITFADEKLEEAIREEIGKWEGPLTVGDVRDIDRLDASRRVNSEPSRHGVLSKPADTQSFEMPSVISARLQDSLN